MLVKDLRAKSNDELNNLVSDLKAELFMLRFQNSTGQLEQPHKIKLVKKDIAKVLTVLNENKGTKSTPAKAEEVKKAPAKKAAPKKEAAPKAEEVKEGK